MSNKKKYIIYLLIASMSFLMMVDIEPIGIVGDYLLKGIGINAWSGNNTGFHLAIIYYGCILTIALKFLKYHRLKLKVSKKKTLLLFVIVVTLLKIGVVEVSESIKGNSEGLLSIGFDEEESNYNIEQENENIKFDVRIKMRNYSDESKAFKIGLEGCYMLGNDKTKILFYDLDGKDSIFTLDKDETKILEINSENYIINYNERRVGDGLWQSQGGIEEIIIESVNGEKVKLNYKEFFGTAIENVR